MADTIKEIDIHGTRPNQLGQMLDKVIFECRSERISTLRIIHGYNNGDALLNFIFFEYKSNDIIDKKRHPKNLGVTYLLLKEEDYD